MYGKAYQAETILRKKKRRPFAKEIIKEANDGDLFNALFSQNIKDVKQKVKQEKTRSNRPHENKISQRPLFADIPEHPKGESVGSSDFLDPFDALLKDTRGQIEKNKDNVCDSQSKSGVKIHEDGKENSPEGENRLVLDYKKKTVVFESIFQGRTKNVTEKPNSTSSKRQPLKLQSDRKGSQVSCKVKEKLNRDRTNSFFNLIDSSCDLDALEDEFRAKMEELRKKKEEHKVISQSKSSLMSASGCEKLSEDNCSGKESCAVCCHLSPPNLCCNRKKSIVNFMSSTPAKDVSLTKHSRLNQNKHEQKRECSGSEDSHQLFAQPSPTQDLSCLLSPILSVTEQRHGKTNHGQKNENICSFARLRFSSKEIENQTNMKYWKEMYRKHNPVPIAVEKITVQPFIHANYEDSATGGNFHPDESVENFSVLKGEKENICPLQQSSDSFADNNDIQEHFQTSTECLVKSETQLEEVHEQSTSTYEHMSKYCHSIENKVTQESDQSDQEKFSCDSIKEERNQSKNNCVCKYMSRIEEDIHTDSQNSLKENGALLQDAIYSPPIKNVCLRRTYGLKSSKLEEKRNTFSAVNDSKPSLNSEIADTVMTSNCSAILPKLCKSEIILDTSSQDGSVCENMSKLSLTESRSSYKAMKKKSFAQRRSHLVVPLAQNTGQIYERISGFREVYISTPSQRQCRDKNLSLSLPVASSNSVLKYENDDLDKEKKDGITFKDVVLELCGQSDMLAFDEAFPESDLADCIKIGEGVYGEVFARLNSHQQPTVMKIMPIEGDWQINGEPQKSFEEILPEIVITAQLSKLRENQYFSTPNFPELIDCWCVQGKYPPRLLKLWQEYDEQKSSENDSPEILPQDQIFIILELSNVGSTLEGFVFNSAEQSWSAFMQVTYTLAVAEASLEFEHRDLHWGNILIKRTTDKTITCKMYGEDHVVPAQGIQASVIDFTLSRITYDGCCIYNNVAEDPTLFEGQGDYQFDIYRMMRDKTENNWQVFQPYSNVLWLSYILEKLITEVYYRNEKTKIHKNGIGKLKEMRSRILDYKSATEVALSFS